MPAPRSILAEIDWTPWGVVCARPGKTLQSGSFLRRRPARRMAPGSEPCSPSAAAQRWRLFQIENNWLKGGLAEQRPARPASGQSLFERGWPPPSRKIEYQAIRIFQSFGIRNGGRTGRDFDGQSLSIVRDSYLADGRLGFRYWPRSRGLSARVAPKHQTDENRRNERASAHKVCEFSDDIRAATAAIVPLRAELSKPELASVRIRPSGRPGSTREAPAARQACSAGSASDPSGTNQSHGRAAGCRRPFAHARPSGRR